MQKEFCYLARPPSDLWDEMWTARTIEKELEACEMEVPPRDLFLSYIPKEGKVLDAGCGFGKWVIYLKRLGYEVAGIDSNALAVDKLREFDPDLQVEVGDILDIHYPDNTFEAYISMGVVEHFEDGPVPALKEAYRILKPDGLIFVSVPTISILRKLVRRRLRNIINAFVELLLALMPYSKKSRRAWFFSAVGSLLPARIITRLPGLGSRYYHFLEYRYSKAELEAYLHESGFEIVETVPHDFYGSKSHAVGLSVDFPFLKARNGTNFRLNPSGRLISRALDAISPWIACSSVICVGRSLKND